MNKWDKALIFSGTISLLAIFIGYYFSAVYENIDSNKTTFFSLIAIFGMAVGPLITMLIYNESPRGKKKKKKQEFNEFIEFKKNVKDADEYVTLFQNMDSLQKEFTSKNSSTTPVEKFSRIDDIYEISTGYQFEIFIGYLLLDLGFDNVGITPQSGDYGADIIAENLGIKYAIQAKYYSQPVGNKAVQEVFAAAQFYHAKIPVVVTNNIFTSAAKKQAATTGVLLWDKTYLNKMTSKAGRL